MSDHWIIVVPSDPSYIPEAALREKAIDYFWRIAPQAATIEQHETERIQFVDCGANFESVSCPSCFKEIAQDWWIDRMDDDCEGGGFNMARFKTPCCDAAGSLNELVYDRPQGFARFVLSAMNPNLRTIGERQKKEFSDILGTPIRAICRHI